MSKWELDAEGVFKTDDVVATARKFAVDYHGKQRYGSHPYVYHLDQVVELLKPYGTTAQVVGYLHHVLEDTNACSLDLEMYFGRFIACMVYMVTDRKGETRKERKIKTNAMLAKIEHTDCPLPLIVKAADRLVNLRESAKGGEHSKLAMYRREHDAFFDAVYRPGICEPIWDEIDKIVHGF